MTNALVMRPVNPGLVRRKDPEMISLPKNWFTQEYFKDLRKVIRGPISKSRRRMVTFKSKIPRETFDELISKMKEDDVAALTWQDGVLQPTKKTSSTLTYKFKTKRPMVADHIMTLERGDLRGVHAREGKGAWRRSLGCATLKLADSARKSARASAFSMVGGNVTVKALVPRRGGVRGQQSQ